MNTFKSAAEELRENTISNKSKVLRRATILLFPSACTCLLQVLLNSYTSFSGQENQRMMIWMIICIVSLRSMIHPFTFTICSDLDTAK